jgi:RimJ/RimL family protein N-acetyltransferase
MMEESRADETTPVALKPVTTEDEAFLYQVYASTRAEEMALVPWNETQRETFLKMQFSAQQVHYRAYYPDSTHDLILLDAQPVGRLYVSRSAEGISILDITILPEHRNKGIGTPLIKRLMDEAAAAGKPLTIYVESFNPSRRLFERLGFSRIEQVEDDGVNYLMEWRAQKQNHATREEEVS